MGVGMRQGEARGLQLPPLIGNDVDIDQARAPDLFADAPHRQFDCQQNIKQINGFKACFNRDCHVGEVGLIGLAPGRGGQHR